MDIPYFRQLDRTSCGVACLRMAASYFGIEKSEEELKEICGTGWTGNVCEDLAKGAVEIGLKSQVLSGMTIDLVKGYIKEKKLIIVLLDPGFLYGGMKGFGHFVLIIKVRKNEVIFHDPDSGPGISFPTGDFLPAWEEFKYKGVVVWKSMKK